jgi:hypothetical protein
LGFSIAVVRVLLVVISVSACATLAYAQRSDEILVRAAHFVEDTSNQLSGVIADEAYQQKLHAPQFTSGTRPLIRQREMHAEALFLWLPAAMEWMFVRNVVIVDNGPVPDSGDRLDRLFKDAGVDRVAYLRQLQEENARFDLGPIFRTLGDPTFALRYLEAESQPRFAFRRIGTERIGDIRATMFSFSERRQPYVVKVNGMDAQSTGTMWIDAAAGTVLRTSLRVLFPSGRGRVASITVDFQKDSRLGIWAPSKMSEEYTSVSGETIIGTASYVNFRRFDTSVRMTSPDAQN